MLVTHLLQATPDDLLRSAQLVVGQTEHVEQVDDLEVSLLHGALRLVQLQRRDERRVGIVEGGSGHQLRQHPLALLVRRRVLSLSLVCAIELLVQPLEILGDLLLGVQLVAHGHDAAASLNSLGKCPLEEEPLAGGHCVDGLADVALVAFD